MLSVSENDNCHMHCAHYKIVVKSHGKQRLKKKALKHPWKTNIVCAATEEMWWGVLGQTVPSTASSNREENNKKHANNNVSWNL